MMLDVLYLGYIGKNYIYMTDMDLKGLEEDDDDDDENGGEAKSGEDEGVGESPLMQAHESYRDRDDKTSSLW